jgi:hypothetical protein
VCDRGHCERGIHSVKDHHSAEQVWQRGAIAAEASDLESAAGQAEREGCTEGVTEPAAVR